MLSDGQPFRKSDLRVQKTERALTDAMEKLLRQCRFTKLTVDRLCREGRLSRATFYSHFADKYDLLAFWLPYFLPYKVKETDTYEETELLINQFFEENKKIIKNLLIDADLQTLEIVQGFICSVLGVNDIKNNDGTITQKNIAAVNLYVGGMVYYLLWQARNNFPVDVPVINVCSFDVIKRLWDWTNES